MPSLKRFQGFEILLLGGWLIVAALIVIGTMRDEGELSDKNTIKLLDYGLSKQYIQIVQERPGEPLQDVSPQIAPTQVDLQRDQVKNVVFNEEQWQRVKRLVRQSVAIANWGLGDPFGYTRNGEKRYVTSFRAADFDYQNPYLIKRPLPISGSTIAWSQDFDRARRGWHVVSRNLMLILRPDAKKDEVVLGSGGAPTESVGLVAKSFLFKYGNGLGLRLSIGDAPFSKDEKIKATRLRVERVNASGEVLGQPTLYQHGQSFLWNGASFIAYNILDPEAANREEHQATLEEDRFEGDGLVFTKYINGKPTRTHLFGEATTNLLGMQLGSYITSFDGALDHSRVKRIELTIDPELQVASFFFLRDTLDKLDSIHSFGRPRRGAVTILDATTGSILTHAGYPSIGPDWASKRRVLVERDAAMRSPADDAHMTGSAVKVLTVSMGYLLFGNAQSDLLPRSKNDLAVRQAFQDAYGVELNAPLEGDNALVTDAARDEFNKEGTPQRVQPEFSDVLKNVYQVLPDIPIETKDEKIDPATREPIISSEFIHLFDQERLLRDFYPQRSRFPVLKAESMERFRQVSLGGWECRFTMLRLAAVLGTAANGKVIQPYIIRSALTNSGKYINKPNLSALTEINVSVRDVEHRREKMKEITSALRKVLVPDGTGYFYTDKNEKIYLGADNPHSPVNEAESRKNDFGKSGTADQDDPDKFNDSLFVYQHGRYLIAIWLEQADAGDQAHPEHRLFEQHTAHTLTNKIVSLIESIEER